MARRKIDPAISRKAYSTAEKALKSLHVEQFALLLDKAYADLGVDSPRVRRNKAAEEVAMKRLLNEQKKERAAQARLEAAAALLRAAGVQVALPGEDAENAA